MNWRIRNVAVGLALMALAAGCSSRNSSAEESSATSPLGLARMAVGQIVADRKTAAMPAAPVNPQAMAAEALAVNPGPLIMVSLESLGTTQVLAMTGENGGMRTFMTTNEQALIMRGFMLTGTRGLGHDLSVAEATQSAALIAARRPGTAQRVMRYYAADGLERPIDFTCQVGSGPKLGTMVEDCAGHGITFQNSYLPSAGVSRQWIGPGIGYATIQVLRN